MTSHTTTIANLRRLREKLEGHWTRGAFARDQNGDTAVICSMNACSWCMAGAAIASVDRAELSAAYAALSPDGLNGVTALNDTILGTEARVLEYIDATIKRLETET